MDKYHVMQLISLPQGHLKGNDSYAMRINEPSSFKYIITLYILFGT